MKCTLQRILNEFRGSAIPDALTLSNVTYAEGEEAIELLCEEAIAAAQKVISYRTQPVKRIYKRYEHMEAGAWFAWGTTLSGDRGSVAYAKPYTARQYIEDGKLKTIKYETAPSCEALPILPFVDDDTAQQIYNHYGVKPKPGETFWQVVDRCGLPIAITEGLKKALCLIAHNIPAIALRGVTCWKRKGTTELHEVISHFATPGREILIAFDQDTKPKTVRDVRRQALKLGEALEKFGANVRYLIWEPTEGKGIDDAIANAENPHQWLDTTKSNALTLNAYKQISKNAAALEMIGRLNRLSYPIERDTEGEYLPELPPLIEGAIHLLIAAMNTGKTTRIGADWVKPAIAAGYRVLVLAPLNSLGQQTAHAWGLPHINDTLDTQQLWEDVRRSGGVVMCPDSLPKIPLWFWDAPILLVLDEANQVIEHTFEGQTLGSRYDVTLQRFGEAIQRAAAIVLSEADLPDRAVNAIRAIAGEDKPVRAFRHRKQGEKWPCSVFTGQASGYRALMLEQVVSRKHLILTSSQREARRAERAIHKRHPSLKVVRIDSETNQNGQFKAFFSSPDAWLKKHAPDVLILSPSAKSGVSIEGGVSVEDAYFSKVWGFFPALATDTHMQLLGRYRPPVPRMIFAPEFILASGDEAIAHPYGIARRFRTNATALAHLHGLAALIDESDRDELSLLLEGVTLQYLIQAKAVAGCQKSVAHDALVAALEANGHQVTCFKVSKNAAASQLWKVVQEEVWREDATAIASSAIDPGIHTPAWAKDKLDSHDASNDERIRAHKVLWREEFPGIAFDDEEECYQALCLNFGAMRRGVLTQVAAENLEATKAAEFRAAEAVLSGKIRSPHRLPRQYAKAWVLEKTGVLGLLDGKAYSNTDPKAIAIKETALKYRGEILYWLRLQIKEDQTPVEVCDKLLKKLGIEKANGMLEVTRPGRRGEQLARLYRVNIEASPVRARLLESARSKLYGSVSMICNLNKLSLNQIVDTAPQRLQIPHQLDTLPPDIAQTFREMWEAAGSEEERAEILEAIAAFQGGQAA